MRIYAHIIMCYSSKLAGLSYVSMHRKIHNKNEQPCNNNWEEKIENEDTYYWWKWFGKNLSGE
jgi:hypothetical protein